jgi:hypothetical protein
MKNWVPQFIKFPLWWIFKSPQRSVGWFSLKNDLLGLGIYLKNSAFPPRNLGSLSICVGLFNRSEQFLSHFIPSLVLCEHQELIELSVFDCGSNDIPDLERRIKAVFTGKLVFKSSSEKPFSRAYAFNQSVQQATEPIVFLCDADFSLPKDLVQKCNSFTPNNTFWFPIVFYLYKNKPNKYSRKNGEWMIWGGKGLLASSRFLYLKLGGLDESFTEWGGEDEAFWLKCHAANCLIIRSREKGLLHHWHPSLNPKYKKLEELADNGLL